jgi:hypothetical protein
MNWVWFPRGLLCQFGIAGSSDYETAKTEFAFARAKWDEANAHGNKK